MQNSDTKWVLVLNKKWCDIMVKEDANPSQKMEKRKDTKRVLLPNKEWKKTGLKRFSFVYLVLITYQP